MATRKRAKTGAPKERGKLKAAPAATPVVAASAPATFLESLKARAAPATKSAPVIHAKCKPCGVIWAWRAGSPKAQEREACGLLDRCEECRHETVRQSPDDVEHLRGRSGQLYVERQRFPLERDW